MDCLFCKIIAGDIPSRKVYEDEAAYAFLDIAPWHPGHTLVVPKRHVDDLTADADVLTEIAPAIGHVSRLLVDHLAADGLNMLSNAGPVAGQEVFHLHVHLVPRYGAEPGLRELIQQRDPGDLDAVHARILAGQSEK